MHVVSAALQHLMVGCKEKGTRGALVRPDSTSSIHLGTQAMLFVADMRQYGAAAPVTTSRMPLGTDGNAAVGLTCNTRCSTLTSRHDTRAWWCALLPYLHYIYYITYLLIDIRFINRWSLNFFIISLSIGIVGFFI